MWAALPGRTSLLASYNSHPYPHCDSTRSPSLRRPEYLQFRPSSKATGFNRPNPFPTRLRSEDERFRLPQPFGFRNSFTEISISEPAHSCICFPRDNNPFNRHSLASSQPLSPSAPMALSPNDQRQHHTTDPCGLSWRPDPVPSSLPRILDVGNEQFSPFREPTLDRRRQSTSPCI